jgi:hypothetical protein
MPIQSIRMGNDYTAQHERSSFDEPVHIITLTDTKG